MQSVLTPDRKLVASRFSTAASVYDRFARHHKMIANELTGFIEHHKPHFESILELGCGTGILSERLNQAFPDAEKVFTDGATGMVDFCRGRIRPSDNVRHGVWDFEQMNCHRNYHLVVSSCALQWLCYPMSFAAKLFSLVKPGGTTAHAIPVKGMLGELDKSFKKTGISWNTLNYNSGVDWDNMLTEAGFRITDSCTRDFTVYYSSATEALRGVRNIGASLSGHLNASRIPPGSLRRALDYYRTEFALDTGEVPATYRVHFVTGIAGKK